MNQKGLVNIIIIIGVIIFVGGVGYFIVTSQIQAPITLSTPSIQLLSPNSGGEFLLGSTIKINWHISSELSSDTNIVILLIEPNGFAKEVGIIASIPANQKSEEYEWENSLVTINGSTQAVDGDRAYRIQVVLYESDSDTITAIKVAEDISDKSFTLSYGGPPQKNVVTDQSDDNQSSLNLTEILEELNDFPEEPCPTPPGRYHTVKFDYIRTNDAGIPILQYPGTNVDTVRIMTEKVLEKMNSLQPNTLIEVYFYEVIVFDPTSGAYSAANDAIQCFNLVL